MVPDLPPGMETIDEATALVAEIEEHIKDSIEEETKGDRVEALRTLRTDRSRLTAFQTLLRDAVEDARGPLNYVTQNVYALRGEQRYLDDRMRRFDHELSVYKLGSQSEDSPGARAESIIESGDQGDGRPLPRSSGIVSTVVAEPPLEAPAGEPFYPGEGPIVSYGNGGYGQRFESLLSAEFERKSMETRAKELDGDIQRQEALRKTYDAYVANGTILIRKLNQTLNRLDEQVGYLLQTETESSEYTSSATRVFGYLVGGVILGFFVIAVISPSVRTAIFSGESGIQFVTLFSLVIAIILFGVLGILEGKELAALLGGLSGYILGRGSGLGNRRETGRGEDECAQQGSR